MILTYMSPIMDHSLVMVKQISYLNGVWTMVCRTTQDRWVMVKSSDKLWSTGGRNDKSLQYSCQENLMNSMKRQKKKKMTLDDEPHSGKMSSMLLGESRGQLLISPERMKELCQSGNEVQLWMCLVVKVKSDAVQKNIS